MNRGVWWFPATNGFLIRPCPQGRFIRDSLGGYNVGQASRRLQKDLARMPYSDLDDKAFWKLCRDAPDFLCADIYTPKFKLAPGMQVATAGSCFAQNIARFLKASEFDFADVEPAPRGMNEAVARRFGCGLFSARYGNIYTSRQLRQLIDDTRLERVHDCAVWEQDGTYFDALRPGVEPEGLTSPEEVLTHRVDHLRRLSELFEKMDVFIFTLGLTETWRDVESGVVFPSAPGVIAGKLDKQRHEFFNMGFVDVLNDMKAAIKALRKIRPGLKIILTVSPVPLTATATGQHVLAATTYSKSVLRAVAGELAQSDDGIDYFPSFELIAGLPFGTTHYEKNWRSVSTSGVGKVMDVFFSAQGSAVPDVTGGTPGRKRGRHAREEDEICEDALLEAFGRS